MPIVGYLERMRRIVIVNPYSAGSHAQWAEGLARALPLAAGSAGTDLEVHIAALPGRHWKWRMHASALVLVERMVQEDWFLAGVDAFIVTDMLDVGQFRAALPPSHRHVPIVLYFHENQLTFPDHPERPRKDWDRHYAFMNVTGALLADGVWFNSGYHRGLFLGAIPDFMSVFPAPRPVDVAERIEASSVVVPIGIEEDVFRSADVPRPTRWGAGPPVVVWNHRWEYDKGPGAFADILEVAGAQGLDFRLAVMGQRFDQEPEAFGRMRERWSDRIVEWGPVDSREGYVEALQSADIALVTAHHDFFGISVLESAAAGLHVVAPRALAYPEHFGEELLHAREDLAGAFVAALEGDRRESVFAARTHAWPEVGAKAWASLAGVWRKA